MPESIDVLRTARREAAAMWQLAVDTLVSHVDDESPDAVVNLIAACDTARERFFDACLRFRAEEFQLSLISVLGRRGDELPEDWQEART